MVLLIFRGQKFYVKTNRFQYNVAYCLDYFKDTKIIGTWCKQSACEEEN